MRRTRSLTLLTTLALIAGACTSSPPSTSTPTSGRVATTTASASASSALPAPAAAAIPTLTWTKCPPPANGGAPTTGFTCATAVVPMDYPHPTTGSFHLALIKSPATDRAHRIGTMFWNPGGPSDAGTQYLPAAIQGFPAEVRQRFDIISWDPRGMGGRTTPVVQCFDSADAEATFLQTAANADIPITAGAFTSFDAGRTELNKRCVAHAGPLIQRVSTADNARDLDLLRQAVGDDKITYYGTSYGTYLGATYINMFPRHVRAAVLDGAVNPTAWAGGAGSDPALSTFLRIGSDLGAAATVQEFMKQCGAVPAAACAFSAGTPGATEQKWAELLRRAAATPIVVDGQSIDNRGLLNTVQGSIYITTQIPGFSRFPGWPAVAAQLQDLWNTSAQPAMNRTPTSKSVAASTSTVRTPPATYTTSAGRQLAVICGESPNPETDEAIDAAAKVSFKRAGLSFWPYVAYCQGWTARSTDTYLGPWNTPTGGPLLVVGNTYDPATPHESSAAMAQQIADGHLLTVDGFGHTELLNPSACAQQHIAAYIIDLTVPPTGTTCKQDNAPFPQH